MHRIVLAGFALVLLILSLLLFFQGGESDRSAATAGAEIASSGNESDSSSAASEAMSDSDEEDSSASGMVDDRRAVSAVPTEGSGHAVEGTVDLSAACGEDSTLEVFALSSETSSERLARLLDRDDEGSSSQILARAAVDANGHFRLPWPEGRTRIHVGLRGRYLRLAQTVPHELESADPVLLVPEAGAWLSVALRSRDGEPLGKIEISCASETPSVDPGNPGGGDFQRFVAHSKEDGTVEFRALPPATAWQLTILPEEYAARKVSVLPLEACESRPIDVTLERGGAIAGHVLGEGGEPLADTKVSALWAGRFFGFDAPELRHVTTDTNGAFRIEALPAGEISVQARRDGFLESAKKKVTVPAEGTLEGLLVTLTTGGSIAGRVAWPDGRPSASVPVQVRFDYSAGGAMGFLNAQRGGQASAKTDEQGAFRVTGLGKGPFLVECSVGSTLELPKGDLAGLPPLTPPMEESEAAITEAPASSASSSDEPVHRARATAVAPGTEDLLLVLRPPAGLWGRAIDPSGAPVREFDAQMHEASSGMFAALVGTRHERHITHEDGRFFIDDLDPGQWELEIHCSTHATVEPVPVELPSTSEAEPLVVMLTPTATVTGIVLSPTGAAVAGATVHEARGGGGMDAIFENQRRDASAVKSDEHGRFRYEGLLPGSMTLYADAADWARSPTVPLDLVGGETISDVELRLLEGGTLTGEVYDAEGKPAPGRMVTAQLLADFQQKMTTTDSAGTFRIERMPPGTWQTASMDGSADWGGGEEGFDPGAMLKSMQLAQVTILDGEETHVILGGLPKDPIHVHGRVTHLGEPYRGAMLTFFAAGDRPLDSMEFSTVDEQGEYEITLEGAGEYVVSVAKITGEPGQQNTVEFPCDIPSGPDFRLDFAIPHARVSGRVFGADGAAVAGARVTLAPDGVARSDSLLGGQYTDLQTDADGRYDIGGLRAGTYRVSAGGASLMGFGADPSTGRLTRGGVRLGEEQWLQDLDFHLEAPGTLLVMVRDANGSPSPGATVFVRDGEGRISEAMSFHQTDGTGTCEYSGLAPGSYSALARLGGDASSESVQVTVRAGESARLEVSLGAGAILWVRFKLDEGEEVPAHVQVTDSAGRDVTALLGMADIQSLYSKGGFSPSEYRVGPLAPGKYKVHAWTDDGKSAKKNVVVEAGETEQRFTLRLGAE